MAGNFLLGIVIVLLALSAYTERQAAAPPASEAVQGESGEPLFSLPPEKIDAIKVLDAHGCVLVRNGRVGRFLGVSHSRLIPDRN